MKTCKELGSVLQMIYISQQLWTVISFEEDMLVKLQMEKTCCAIPHQSIISIFNRETFLIYGFVLKFKLWFINDDTQLATRRTVSLPNILMRVNKCTF